MIERKFKTPEWWILTKAQNHDTQHFILRKRKHEMIIGMFATQVKSRSTTGFNTSLLYRLREKMDLIPHFLTQWCTGYKPIQSSPIQCSKMESDSSWGLYTALMSQVCCPKWTQYRSIFSEFPQKHFELTHRKLPQSNIRVVVQLVLVSNSHTGFQ